MGACYPVSLYSLYLERLLLGVWKTPLRRGACPLADILLLCVKALCAGGCPPSSARAALARLGL